MKDGPSQAAVMDHAERFAILDSIQGQSLAELQPNVILRRVNAGIDELVAAMQHEDLERQRAAVAAARERFNQPSALNWDLAGQIALVSALVQRILSANHGWF